MWFGNLVKGRLFPIQSQFGCILQKDQNNSKSLNKREKYIFSHITEVQGQAFELQSYSSIKLGQLRVFQALHPTLRECDQSDPLLGRRLEEERRPCLSRRPPEFPPNITDWTLSMWPHLFFFQGAFWEFIFID